MNAARRLPDGLELRIDDGRERSSRAAPRTPEGPAYPTRRLQRGLLLFDGGTISPRRASASACPSSSAACRRSSPGLELT